MGALAPTQGTAKPLPAKALPRALGLPLEGVTGAANAITDVPGVGVGYWHCDNLLPDGRPFRSGVTALMPDAGDVLWSYPAAIHVQNGNGELTGSHWVNDSGRLTGPVLLTNSHAVGAVHEAAVRWLIGRFPSVYRDDHAWALPVVAETYDGFTNDILGLHVRPEHAIMALEAACASAALTGDRRIAQGNVGGGTGMQSFGLKGGSGSSSRRLMRHGGSAGSIGVFVQSNFGARHQLRVGGVAMGALLQQGDPFAGVVPETGSLIVIVATDLPLDARQLAHVARRTSMGAARLGGTAGHYSGEMSLAFSIANRLRAAGVSPRGQHCHVQQLLDESMLDDVYEATVQATEEAVLNAMFSARSMPTHKPPGLLEAIDQQQVLTLLRSHGLLRTCPEPPC